MAEHPRVHTTVTDQSQDSTLQPGLFSRDSQTGSTLEYRNGLAILHLYGDPYERGLAHGRLLRDKIQSSRAAEYYGRFLEQLYRSSDTVRKIPAPLRTSICRLMEWWFYAPLERLCMEETQAEIQGVADGAGIDARLALRGVLAPDVIEALAAGFLKNGRQSLGNYYLGGCTTAFARKSACLDQSHVYFGRNMDFPGAFVWRHPAVIFSHPTEHIKTLVSDGIGDYTWEVRQKQPYMYITTAGFPGFGLTGMSASGIALGTYVCLSRNIGGRSKPFLDYNHYLLTRAESIEGIEHILRTERPTSVSPHVALFASASGALTVEVDSRQVAARTLSPDFDILAQTNHFSNPKLKRRELEYPLSRENSIGRYRMVLSALEESYAQVDIQHMVDIMSANVDLAGRRSGMLGDFPGQPSTLTSVVFELGKGDFWVAGGVPPAVCFNSYHGFNFFDEVNGRTAVRQQKSYRQSAKPVLTGVDFQPVTESMRKSLRYLMLSQEMLKMGKRQFALRRLLRAIELYRDPAYLYILGILMLADGNYDEALLRFDSLLEKPYLFPPVKESALRLWKARTMDLLGRRSEAVEIYRYLLQDGNLAPQLRKVARKELRGRFDPRSIPASFDYGTLGPLLF